MASWHQEQAMRRAARQGKLDLRHPTLWIVVEDNPNGMMALSSHDDEHAADVRIAVLAGKQPHLTTWKLAPKGTEPESSSEQSSGQECESSGNSQTPTAETSSPKVRDAKPISGEDHRSS